jgi:hypothetical protein
MYFNNFQNIYYQYDIGGKPVLKVVKDITTNVRFRKAVLDNITLFDEYDVKDGETPEIIAAKYYGNPEYHWVIMLCNQRYDYLEDFPKSTHALEDYINGKYANPYGTHHYEVDGFIVSQGTPGAVPVSNYEYEDRLNESKRRIKLISPQLLNQIIANFKSII